MKNVELQNKKSAKKYRWVKAVRTFTTPWPAETRKMDARRICSFQQFSDINIWNSRAQSVCIIQDWGHLYPAGCFCLKEPHLERWCRIRFVNNLLFYQNWTRAHLFVHTYIFIYIFVYEFWHFNAHNEFTFQY